MHVPLQPWHGPLCKLIFEASHAAVEFFHLMYRNGVWLRPEIAMQMAEHSHRFCACYSQLARACHERKLSRYHLEPSLHYFYHYFVDLKASVDLGVDKILSPAISSCECDEDFVGKLSRLSRNTHAATQSIRTTERYLAKCFFDYENNN